MRVKKKNTKKISGCIEEFEPENITEILDGALVVDARITDENKQQTILLTRTFSFDETDPTPEIGAQVSIVDELGGTIDFIENKPGNYSTIEAISLEQDRAYTLQITTTDNVIYQSNKTTLPSKIELAELVPLSQENLQIPLRNAERTQDFQISNFLRDLVARKNQRRWLTSITPHPPLRNAERQSGGIWRIAITPPPLRNKFR